MELMTFGKAIARRASEIVQVTLDVNAAELRVRALSPTEHNYQVAVQKCPAFDGSLERQRALERVAYWLAMGEKPERAACAAVSYLHEVMHLVRAAGQMSAATKTATDAFGNLNDSAEGAAASLTRFAAAVSRNKHLRSTGRGRNKRFHRSGRGTFPA
jgi:hypothetical protein